MYRTTLAFAGSGEISPETAGPLLNDLLPAEEDDTREIGAIYRPDRFPRAVPSKGLKVAIDWLEAELGKRNVVGTDDLLGSLLDRRKQGDDVTLVVVWPDEPTDDELSLVRAASENDIPVKNLANALYDLVLEEPEPAPEEATGEPERAIPGTPFTEAEIRALKALAAGVMSLSPEDAPRPAKVTRPSTRTDAVRALPKTRPGPVEAEEVQDDTPPFDKPYSVKLQAAPGGDDDSSTIPYYMSQDGVYRQASGPSGRRLKAKPGEELVLLSPDEVDDMIRNKKVKFIDNK